MNFLPLSKQPLLKENNKKGFILLVTVIILAGIILILIVGSYLSLNLIRWESFSLPEASQSLNNAESCFNIALSKLKISPAYHTQGNWEEFKNGDIFCQYLIENGEGGKIIKTKGVKSGYFKKILIKLKI